MKTLADLMIMVHSAIEENNENGSPNWFFNFSGHVNEFHVRYYLTGWDTDAIPESLRVDLDEDGINAAWWWIKIKLRK